ncbi:MAG TPA: glycosyltransferase family 39 protein [Chloroflexota bacterium]|jgi:4-amino-4-deoxy-L-arabinose transferase-like glycosyltransferase
MRLPEVGSAHARALAAPLVPLITPILVIALLALSFLKELQLLNQGGATSLFVWLGALGLLAGAALALGAPLAPDPRSWILVGDRARRAGWPRCLLAVVAVVLALAAALMVHSAGSPTVATVAWAVGLVCILAAALDGGALATLRSLPSRARMLDVRRAWPALILLAILLVASALRLPNLATIPGFLHNDEGSNGLMARAVAEGQVPSLFANGWASLPILGYAWEGLFLKLFGDSLTSLRLASAVPGIASVLIVALLGKELFTWRAGLLAAAILTFLHIDIHFSRVGHHYMHAQFAVTLTLYLLVLALRYGAPVAAVGVGILLSVDIQVYYAARVAYVIVPLVAAYVLLISDRERFRDRLPLIGWIILGWIVAVAPIGVVILSDWSSFTGRTREVLVLGGTLDTQHHVYGYYGTHDVWIILRTQIWRVAQTFNFAGDSSEQYGSYHPMLDPVSAALFPSALVYACSRIRRAGFAICLIAFFSAIIVGGVLTIDPAFWPRLIVVPPILALIIGAFLDGLWQALDRVPRTLVPASLAAVLVLAAIGYGNYQWYFNDFQTRIRINYIAAPMDVGTYLRSITDDPSVYGITDGSMYMDHQAIQVLAPHIQTCNILIGIDISQCPFTPGKDRVFVVVPARVRVLGQLRATYPGGVLHLLKTYDNGGKIYIYRIQG